MMYPIRGCQIINIIIIIIISYYYISLIWRTQVHVPYIDELLGYALTFIELWL